VRLVSASLSLIGLASAGLLWWLLAGLVGEPRGAATMAVRLGLALAALLPALIVLAAMILAQMLLRFAAGAFDPLAGRDGRLLAVNQRVIANTLEQMALFVPALLAWAAGAAPGEMRWVIALGPVFAASRLVFWAGYVIDPMARAAGMAPSFVAALMAIGAAVVAWTR
jgi:hypothetical protein